MPGGILKLLEGICCNQKIFLKFKSAQIFLDVDCSHLNYSTPVSDQVLAAAEKVLEQSMSFDPREDDFPKGETKKQRLGQRS